MDQVKMVDLGYFALRVFYTPAGVPDHMVVLVPTNVSLGDESVRAIIEALKTQP
jgi:hypothetical protein